MYRNLIKVAKDVVKLANKRDKDRRENKTFKIISLADIQISDEVDLLSKQIVELLMKLNRDEVIALQTIMYLGRENNVEQKSPDEIFFTRFDEVKSSSQDSKEIEVLYMVDKPLGEYLTEGYRILGIKL
ncbi:MULTISPECIES: DUF3775 domain-containing protein [Streptococcus]|uniref:DUF3775 domain-containing protein n=1 Tax=Streptococcus mitis TaxID=28037 RepID=A0A081QS62_STRMT|nr:MULTISPECIES: DUF3775 domain-containing protein [Streptococcus]KEQ45785.1 hypothetical protein SK608_1642 [Streptococcus mitis]